MTDEKPKPGRPVAIPGAVLFAVRYSPEQAAAIRASSKAAGQTVTEWLRRAAAEKLMTPE